MDFSQTKLTKSEWESIEVPVADAEKKILRLIQDGYHDVNLKINPHPSMMSYMKIEYTPEIETHLYVTYFEKEIRAILAPPPQATSSKKKHTPAAIAAIEATTSPHPNFTLPNVSKCKPPRKIDLLRLTNMDAQLKSTQFDTQTIFEYKQLAFCRQALSQQADYIYYLYTLIQMRKSVISHLNQYVQQFVDQVISHLTTDRSRSGASLIQDAFDQSYTIIEKNPHILQVENQTLYDHQKQLFQLFKKPLHPATGEPVPDSTPRLVLYTAPTGTGKTMSPLGLIHGYRVLFICAARHVGLALARSAISMEKRVAFAFGCETAADIRLHYYAAAEFTKNRKSGGIYKVDNSDGSKVELMICDVRSYVTAMHYMLAFNEEPNILLYWDEPTITLDLETHPLHEVIQRNWRENKISKIILSCATLPQEDEIADCLSDFRGKFGTAECADCAVHSITSFDCKKTVTILNSQGDRVLPHLFFPEYTQIQACIAQCYRNRSLLRYLDLREIVRMVRCVMSIPGALPDAYHVPNYFNQLSDLTMNRLKMYYLDVLAHLDPAVYPAIHRELTLQVPVPVPTQKGRPLTKLQSVDSSTALESAVAVATEIASFERKFRNVSGGTLNIFRRTTEGSPSEYGRSLSASAVPKPTTASSGILLTTEDAHTLTDGPAIFLVEDVAKIGKFYLQQSKIPARILDGIMEKIDANNQIQGKMDTLLKSLDDTMGAEVEKDKKAEKESYKPEVKRIMNQIDALRTEIKLVSMESAYVPNTRPHQHIWVRDDRLVENAFVPQIEEAVVRKIMELGVDSQMKLLLLLGIGVFDSTSTLCIQYVELMKRLAYDQKLFLIIASSDYIYGTNYQLCHGFLGKDLLNMTQQKIIQAMGRIGRSHIQQEYTIRFRDETLLTRLFLPVESNLEAVNMCRLLSSP